MKKRGIIIITVVVVLGIVVGAGALLFGSRIRTAASVVRSVSMNQEDITARAEENARTEQEMQERFAIPETAAQEDVLSALEDGTLTLEEAAARLLESASAPASSETQQTPSGSVEEIPSSTVVEETPSGSVEETPSGGAVEETPSGSVEETPSVPVVEETPSGGAEETPSGTAVEETPSGGVEETPSGSVEETPSGNTETAAPEGPSEEERRLQNLVTQLTILRGTFTSKVDGIIAECIAEFLALPPEEQTTTSKMRIVYARLDEAAAMEEDCDRQVAEIVDQIRQLDPDLAAQAERQYQNEKDLKKASLIEQYA